MLAGADLPLQNASTGAVEVPVSQRGGLSYGVLTAGLSHLQLLQPPATSRGSWSSQSVHACLRFVPSRRPSPDCRQHACKMEKSQTPTQTGAKRTTHRCCFTKLTPSNLGDTTRTLYMEPQPPVHECMSALLRNMQTSASAHKPETSVTSATSADSESFRIDANWTSDSLLLANVRICWAGRGAIFSTRDKAISLLGNY